jgi:hypothetical protein
MDSCALAEQFDTHFPPTIMGAYFIPGDVEFLERDGKIVGFRVRHDPELYAALVAHGFVDATAPVAEWGPVRGSRELFERCYRTKRCTNPKCGRELAATEFDWKVRRTEGPFHDIWGKRDSFCKNCRSLQKSARYSALRRQKEKLRLRRASTTIWDMDRASVQVTFAPFKDGDASVLRDLADRLTIG